MAGVEGRRDADFEAFFRAQLPRARRVAHRILGDETSAEDAAAEAFARAHASWRKVGGLPYRDAWILRVTSNVAVDMTRKRRPTVSLTEPTFAATLDDAGRDEQDHTVLRVALVVALAGLPRRQREVVALHYLEGLSEAEVAACLRISVGTVKKTSSRARDALRDQLGDDWGRIAPAVSG